MVAALLGQNLGARQLPQVLVFVQHLRANLPAAAPISALRQRLFPRHSDGNLVEARSVVEDQLI